MQAMVKLETATSEANSKLSQNATALIANEFNQADAYITFRKAGFAKGRDINALVQNDELTYPVRGDEFVVKSAPGKKLGAQIKSDGFVYNVRAFVII